jgi:adenosylhomocysteinase
MMEWINERMSLVRKACDEVKKSIDGISLALCFPLEFKTAVLAYELSKICELNVCKFDEPTTKKEAVEWLENKGVEIKKMEDCLNAEYYLDCVATLTYLANKKDRTVKGVIELTKSGVERLANLNNYKKAISIDDSLIKGLGENRFGTGWGLIDSLIRLNIFLPGKRVFVIGYGRVGEGCCHALRDCGCIVYVYDRDDIRRAIAEYNGFKVLEIEDGLGKADIIVTATGVNSVINSENVHHIKNGAILCNMGAGKYEIDCREFKDYRIKNLGCISKYEGRNHFYLLANGNPANLSVGFGTPVEIMDKTFSLSLFALEYIINNDFRGVIDTPEEVERKLVKLLRL